MLENYDLTIPDVEIVNDLTIIYKGKDETEEGGEKIIQIKTSKDEFLKKLRYFKAKSNEINLMEDVYIHDTFTCKVFKDFIDSIISKHVSINANNYSSYHELSSKYKYYELQRQVEDFISTRPDLKLIISDISTEKDENIETRAIKEEIIAKNFDICLKSGYLNEIPLPSLIRIIKSPKRKIENHHELFEFIMKKIERNQNEKYEEDIEILPSFLNYQEMSIQEINEFIKIQEKASFFKPQHSEYVIKTFLEEINEMKQHNQNIEQKIESMLIKFKEQENLINNLTDEYKINLAKQEQINEQHKKKNEEHDQINNVYKMNFNKQEQIIDQLKKKIDELNQKNAEYKKIFDKQEQINKQLEQINKEEKSKNDEKESVLNKLKMKITEQEKIIQTLKESQERQSVQITEINKKIDIKSQVKKKVEIIKEIPKVSQKNEGIFNYFLTKSKIDDEIKIGYSSLHGGEKIDIIKINNINNDFYTSNSENSWISFYFKKCKIIPTNYAIRSIKKESGDFHPKSWVIQGADEDKKWITLDEQIDSQYLNGPSFIHTFNISNTEVKDRSFCYLRIIQKGKNFGGDYSLNFCSIEFYGKIVKIS